MTTPFDLTSLQLILNVAEAASITHGARRSHLSLAAASERIRSLETAIGTPLFERKRRGVELTAAGSTVVRHATLALQQLDHMRDELGRQAKGLRVRVRLLSNTVGLLEYLPKALSVYLAAHPHVDVDLEERSSRQIVQSINAGRADLGIVGGTLDVEASEIETAPLAENRLVLIVPRGHPLAGFRCTDFAEALGFDWVGLAENSVLQSYVDERARLAGRRLKIRVRLGTFDAIAVMVARGIGIALVPEVAGSRWAQSSALKVVALNDEWATRPLTVCARRAGLLSTEARQLLECLRTSVAQPILRKRRASR